MDAEGCGIVGEALVAVAVVVVQQGRKMLKRHGLVLLCVIGSCKVILVGRHTVMVLDHDSSEYTVVGDDGGTVAVVELQVN